MENLTLEQLTQIREDAGKHTWNKAPKDPDQRLYYGLLEILDFECCKYGDIPKGVTEEKIKRYLLEHKGEVLELKEPPSYIGLFAGVYDFLTIKKKERK